MGVHLVETRGIDRAIDDALRLGFKGLMVKAHDGNPADDTPEFRRQVNTALERGKREGLTVGAWGYLYGPRYGNRQVDVEAQAMRRSGRQLGQFADGRGGCRARPVRNSCRLPQGMTAMLYPAVSTRRSSHALRRWRHTWAASGSWSTSRLMSERQ